MNLCTVCQDPRLSEANFPRDKSKRSGLGSKCRSCKNRASLVHYKKTEEEQRAKKREYYKANKKEIASRKQKNYRTNKRLYLSRKYSSIQAHIKYTKSYKGRKCTFTREEFVLFGLGSGAFHTLWDNWIASGYERAESPSIDRVKENGNYTLDNIQFLTFSENAIKGNEGPEIAQYHTEPQEESEFHI